MRGSMGSEAGGAEEGRVKPPRAMLLLAIVMWALFTAFSLGNLAFGITWGVMLGGSRYSGEFVHWHGQPIQFSITFCMSSFILGFCIYVVVAKLKMAKAKREARTGESPGEA